MQVMRHATIANTGPKTVCGMAKNAAAWYKFGAARWWNTERPLTNPSSASARMADPTMPNDGQAVTCPEPKAERPTTGWLLENLSKRCSQCGQLKPITTFPKNTRTKDGRRSNCGDCQNGRKRDRYAVRGEDRTEQHRKHLRRTYGLTQAQYTSMLVEQSGRCACCLDDLAGPRRPHVDHCHTTGRVRGLLCHHCNVALGAVKEDHRRIAALAGYLRRSTE